MNQIDESGEANVVDTNLEIVSILITIIITKCHRDDSQVRY